MRERLAGPKIQWVDGMRIRSERVGVNPLKRAEGERERERARTNSVVANAELIQDRHKHHKEEETDGTAVDSHRSSNL